MRRKRTLEQEAARAMRKQLKAFRKKFGRDPGPNDPVYFDPNSEVPKQMNPEEFDKVLMDALVKSGAPPEVIYANKKTGRLGVRGAMDNWPEEARREWGEAIDEYVKLEGAAEKGKTS